MQLEAQNGFFELAHAAVREATVSSIGFAESSQIQFQNPIFRSLLGTERGWGLLLVMSLIVIGQSFEYLKKTAIKCLPERLNIFGMICIFR